MKPEWYNSQILQAWIDPRLAWNTTGEFKNHRHLQVSDSKIWVPDIEVLNR